MDDDPDEPSLDAMGALPWHEASEGELDDGLLDREVRSRLRSRLLGEPHEPLRVGRFRLLRKLGQGGMGTVYAAYDDELDREVAIKVLHPWQRHDDLATQRMRREAIALARLSHPNLVPVFEVGEHEGQVFLAMELVHGIDMREWVRREPRPWQAVLAHWLDVARALARVHEAGLVHRDVKPSNVLIGEDGRARLVDFGLARGRHASDDGGSAVSEQPDSTEAVGASRSGAARLQQIITEAHAVVGTPAYMAPEVQHGEAAGPWADQYSLCASIYEGLHGQRPTPDPRNGSGAAGPERTAVPLAVRRVLVRGLAREPSERFADVDALVRALERAISRRRQRLLAAAAALFVAAGAGALGARALEPERPPIADPCAATDDDLHDVWDEERRTTLREALLATEVPYAPRLSERLDRLLHEYTGAWLRARRQVCQATHVEHVQSESLLDRRMICLDQQRHALDAMLETATRVRADEVPRLPLILAALGSPAECLDEAVAASTMSLPPNEVREDVDRLRASLARLRQQALLHGPKDALGPTEALVEQAEQLGYRPLLAEARLMLGLLHGLANDPRARPSLERAVNLAEAVDHVEVKEEALQRLVRLATDVELDVVEAQRTLERQLAVIERLGAPPRRLAAAVGLQAGLRALADDYEAAEADLRRAVALWEAQGESQIPGHATALRDLGNLLVGRNRPDEAHAAFERAAELEASWGRTSDPDALLGYTVRGQGELVRGVASTNAGRFEEAASWLARAHREASRAYGGDSVPVGRIAVARADLALRRGLIAEVLAQAEIADACFRRWLGGDHPLRAGALAAMGTAAFHLGQAERAVEAFAEELRVSSLALPPHGVRVATARSNLGEALVLAARPDEAEPELRRALADLERALPPTDVLLSFPAHALAEIAWERRDLDDARRHAQRALAIREQRADLPVELARTRWLLARVEHALAEPASARVLAEAAREGLKGLGPAFVGRVREIDDWLLALP